MASLSSFVNSSQYIKENLTFPFVAGMVLGTGYSGVSFAGVCGATNRDPGGMFGWLIYSRSTIASPAKGLTTDPYIVYTNPYDLVGDLNLLRGITSCLISGTGAGGTFGFFTNVSGTSIEPTNIGTQFLHAINYLAYGGTLVIAGSVGGLSTYLSRTQTYFDIVIDPYLNSNVAQWLIDEPYTIGIFPTIPSLDSGLSGFTGGGNTLANFATLLGDSSFVTGATGVANRIFSVKGLKTVSNVDTSTLLPSSKITYTISAVNDVGGFFARTKNRNETYLTVAGLDRATVINGNIIDPINWEDSFKNSLKTNKVNFFVNYNPKFLGSDLVGATASTQPITVNDRIGPARMRADLTKIITQIGLRHIFDINDQSTREQVVSEVQTSLEPFAPFLNTSQTQIICSEVNNTNNSSALTIQVVVQPILSTDTLFIDLTFTQQ